jgi:hypothetical protein
MAIPLGRSLPSASCDRPERRREGSPGISGYFRNACRSYLVLLPVGFSLPPPLPAARCALTAPFHPCRPAVSRDGPAVYFLWHFPWGRPRRALPGTAPPWSPDFPLPTKKRGAAIRPSGKKVIWVPAPRLSKGGAPPCQRSAWRMPVEVRVHGFRVHGCAVPRNDDRAANRGAFHRGRAIRGSAPRSA